MDNFEGYKVTETGQILLIYTNKIIFKNILNSKYYENVLTLNIAISILCSPELSQSLVYVWFADTLLTYFVKQGVILFGNIFCIYNVHCLLHLSDDVTQYCSLDQNSSFKVEIYLQYIKKLGRNDKNPLTKISNRIDEFTKHYNPLITKLHST